jgi:hypothetical protein
MDRLIVVLCFSLFKTDGEAFISISERKEGLILDSSCIYAIDVLMFGVDSDLESVMLGLMCQTG